MTQSIKSARTALFTACRDTIFAGQVDGTGAPVLVTFGRPGKYQANYIVAVGMSTKRPIATPTMGTNRSREATAAIEVWFSTYVQGKPDVAQPAAMDACDDLIDLLEAHFRTSPNETLGGACRLALVTNADGPETEPLTNPETKAVTGYMAAAIVTVTASIRY